MSKYIVWVKGRVDGTEDAANAALAKLEDVMCDFGILMDGDVEEEDDA